MGSFIRPSPIRAVHFAKQNVTETLREEWDEAGVTYQGQIPPGVKVGDPLVVRPSERETWWLVIEGSESDLRARKFRARITLIRDRDEVEYLQGVVETALLRFVTHEFPSYRVTVERDRAPQRGVTLFAVGPEKPLHYGSGGKLSKGWANLVLGDIPHERDAKHPYVSSIKVADVGTEGELRKYRIRADVS
jgi:hypothetical protein